MPQKNAGGKNTSDKSSSKVADKTFGMKNKSKSKAVQQMHKQAQGGEHANQDRFKTDAASKKKAEAAALDSLLFNEAVKKKKPPKEAEQKKKEVVEEAPMPTELEERIEWQRARITTRTPVTLERLQDWLKAKQDAKAAEQNSKLDKAKANIASGKKAAGMTGRDLFSIDPNLFTDDADAGDDKFEERVGTDDEEDEEDGEGGEGDAGAKGKGRGQAALKSDLIVGERVKARYGNGRIWYDGVITAVNEDATADILYADGDNEDHVLRDNIKPVDRAPAAEPAPSEAASEGTSAAAAASSGAVASAAASSSGDAGDLAAQAAAIDLATVDESLFLNEDLPDDDDLPDD